MSHASVLPGVAVSYLDVNLLSKPNKDELDLVRILSRLLQHLGDWQQQHIVDCSP